MNCLKFLLFPKADVKQAVDLTDQVILILVCLPLKVSHAQMSTNLLKHFGGWGLFRIKMDQFKHPLRNSSVVRLLKF